MTRFFQWHDKRLEYEEMSCGLDMFRAYAGMDNFCNNISKIPPKLLMTDLCGFCEMKLEEECYFFTCPLIESIICKDCGVGLNESTLKTIHCYKMKKND